MSARERRWKYKNRVRAWYEDFKRHASCLECGARWPTELHFHHIDPTTKNGTVAHLVQEAHSKETILIELEKCVVLCRDCHARLHGIDPADFKNGVANQDDEMRRQGRTDFQYSEEAN